MEKRLMTFIACLFLFIGSALAQTQVSGTVTSSEDGSPVIGASIKVVGTNTGTVTDADGNFSLNVPAGAKLEVTYLGMQPKTVKASNNLKVVLDTDNKALDEVVVTAMGISRDKKALGYASQKLGAEDLNISGTSSLASAMQGKLTGVDIRQSSGAPGASAQIVIRGARSFSGDNTPLYVVDGMPIASSADYGTGASVTGADQANRSIDINPDDIESIDVLKGQAASALYGIRASNGVILITTKRGKANGGRPVITFSTDLSAQTVSRKFERQTVYAQGNGVDNYDPTSSASWGPKITELANDPVYGGNTDNEFTQRYGKHAGQYYNPKYAAAGLDGWATPQVYDNVGDFFNTGFTQNSNFGISQKKGNLAYSFGIGDTYQTGIVPSTGMMRTTARGSVDFEINKEWKTGFSANYSSTKITSAPGANSGIINVVYSAPAEYNLKGTPYCSPTDPTSQILFRSTSFNNPYWWADNDEYSQRTNRVFGNAYVEFRPNFNWDKERYNLVFREQAGIDVYTTNNSTIAEVGSAYNKSGEVENYGVQHNIFNNLFTANFTAKFGAEQQWDFGALLGSEFNHDYQRYWDYDGTNLLFYGQPTIANTTVKAYTSEYMASERTVGFFGQLSLSYANQVYLTVTGRNDIVSTMPRGNRSFFYPSVSLGWLFTELPALKDNHILSYGKLRASFAQVGQAGHYYANYYSVPTYGSGMYTFTPFSYPSNGVSAYAPYYIKYDPNLKPQNTVNWEFGADLNFFNNRIRLEYTASYQDIKDQIFDVPTAGSTGYQYLRTNAGEMTTWSHELSLNASIIQTKDWDLDLGINYTTLTNKVKSLADGVESIFLGGFTQPQVRAQAGYTYPIIYGTAFKRDDEGRLLLDDNGLPQGTADSQPLGECTPDFNMGFNLKARWKRLTLSATMDWQKGGKMYNGTLLTLNYFGATKESLEYHEGTMVVDGIIESTGQKSAKVVSKQAYWMYYNDVTEAGIYDRSYLKLRDVTLNYQLPKLGNFDISIYGFARNILLWSKMKDLDPESSQGNGNMSGCFERFSLPNTSSFGGGFKITF